MLCLYRCAGIKEGMIRRKPFVGGVTKLRSAGEKSMMEFRLGGKVDYTLAHAEVTNYFLIHFFLNIYSAKFTFAAANYLNLRISRIKPQFKTIR